MPAKPLLGYIGAIALCFGVFLPFMNVPGHGPLTYYASNVGDGKFALALGAIALIFVLLRRYRLLWYPALCAAGIVGFSIYRFTTFRGQSLNDLSGDLEGNPFGPIAEAMAS